MVRIMLAVVVGICLFPHLLFGQEAAQPHPIRVYLSASGPEGLEEAIRTRVAEELEAQGDMTVSEIHSHWTLQIVALKLECPPGSKGTVAVSVLILETFPNDPLRVFLTDKVDGATLAAIGRLTSGLFRYSRHWIETAPAGDVQDIARAIVTRFRLAVARQQGTVATEN
jgi:hypothetical protein